MSLALGSKEASDTCLCVSLQAVSRYDFFQIVKAKDRFSKPMEDQQGIGEERTNMFNQGGVCPVTFLCEPCKVCILLQVHFGTDAACLDR